MGVKVKATRHVLGLRPGQVADVEQTPYLKLLLDGGAVERVKGEDGGGRPAKHLEAAPSST